MLVRQTVVLVSTVLLNGSPVYEWRLNIIGGIHRQAYISLIHVRRDKSPALEFWPVTLYTWHHTHQSGVWSAASTDELGLHFLVVSPVSFTFLTGALLCLYTALRAHVVTEDTLTN